MPTPDLTAAEVIRLLELEPLPVEGGYFRPTYHGPIQLPSALLPTGSTLERSITSAIYYLLTADTISRLHRLPIDEMWHFYMGDRSNFTSFSLTVTTRNAPWDMIWPKARPYRRSFPRIAGLARAC